MTDYKEEQANEIEALQSIYPEEFIETGQDPWEFELTILPESSGDDDEDEQISVILAFKFGPTYPDAEPEMTVSSSENLSEEAIVSMLEMLMQTATENLGMVMVFTLVSAVQELLNEKRDEGKRQRQREKEEREEAARKAAEAPIFSGTAVTVETFNAWQIKFLAEKKGPQVQVEETQGKLTGRQLFERDASLSQSDMRFLQDFEEDVEVIESAEPSDVAVDESLFQDIGDLDLDDDELN